MPEWERKEGREQEIPCQVKPEELGSLSLLQEIFLTQNPTGVSCIAGGFFSS